MTHGVVAAVSRNATHAVSKEPRELIRLLAGLGVENDAHAGATVRHRSRLPANATAPNLRQVHLIHAELLDELAASGFTVSPGLLGENVTTRRMALLELPAGARLRLGERAVVEVTGLRNPCVQLDGLQPGLMSATLARAPDGKLVRKAGVMATVVTGGMVRPGDPIVVELPAGRQRALEPV